MILKVEGITNPEDIFKGDIAELLPVVQSANKIMSIFKDEFLKYKEKLPSLFPPGAQVRPWLFSPDMVFSRFDKVHDRLKTVFVSGGIERYNF